MPMIQELPPGALPPEIANLFLGRRRPPMPGGNNTANIVDLGNNETVQVMDEKEFFQNVLHMKMMPARRATPTTFVGSFLLPTLAAIATIVIFLWFVFPPKYAELCEKVKLMQSHPIYQKVWRKITIVQQRFNLTADRITTICVSCYFLHEGFSAWQIKWTEMAQSMVPVRTPFGYMRMVPHWQKGDAVDLVLLVTAFCTGANILPEIGLVLLLVDVVSDVIDMLAQMGIVYMVEGSFQISELMAKKVSLLGVMILVTLHNWRKKRNAAASKNVTTLVEDDDSSTTLGNVALLQGRILMAVIFFQCAVNELGRLYFSNANVDIDPNDGHNVVWPKVIELALAIPLVIGWQTKHASCLLAAVLALEAVSVWQFWRIQELQFRLHNREHFAVNVAVAGGLMLLQSTGGGRFTVEQLLKKAS